MLPSLTPQTTTTFQPQQPPQSFPQSQPSNLSQPLSQPSQPSQQFQSSNLSINTVLNTLHQLRLDYPKNIDNALYQLHTFSAVPDTEKIDDIHFPILNQAIQITCEYIFNNHYPFRDDACELFIIQAQSWARYGIWDMFPKVLKFCQFAKECSPNVLQQQRIDSIENIAYGYKYKRQVESFVFGLAKTWIAFHATLGFYQYLFPFHYSDDEVASYRLLNLGVSPDGTHRDIGPYLNTPDTPFELLSPSQHALLENLTTKANELPRRILPPSPE